MRLSHSNERRGVRKARCNAQGCSNNNVINGGVCIRHGAKKKQSCVDEFANKAQLPGVCRRHRACRNHHDASTSYLLHHEDQRAPFVIPCQVIYYVEIHHIVLKSSEQDLMCDVTLNVIILAYTVVVLQLLLFHVPKGRRKVNPSQH